MNKFFRMFTSLVIGAGFVVSVAVLPACGDDVLIDGNFSAVASDEQLEMVRTYIINSDESIVGQTDGEWGYNARMYINGGLNYSMNFTAGDVSNSMSTDISMDSDHTVTVTGNGDEITARGSGSVYYSADVALNDSSGSETHEMKVMLKGNSYNDDDYFYIDGEARFDNLGMTTTTEGKFKLYLQSALETLFMGSAVSDVSVLLETFDMPGATVYIDDSSDCKIKVSLDIDAWADLYHEILSGSLSDMLPDMNSEDIISNIDFDACDYYFEFDPESGLFLGCGSVIDARFDISFDYGEYSASAAYDIDLSSWFVSTDTEAARLPDDLSDYQVINV